MAELQAVVAELESVPEEIRDFYTEQDAGGFQLTVVAKDGVELANTERLKSALAKERTRADKAEKALKGFEGVDPERRERRWSGLNSLRTLIPRKRPTSLRARSSKPSSLKWSRSIGPRWTR